MDKFVFQYLIAWFFFQSFAVASPFPVEEIPREETILVVKGEGRFLKISTKKEYLLTYLKPFSMGLVLIGENFKFLGNIGDKPITNIGAMLDDIEGKYGPIERAVLYGTSYEGSHYHTAASKISAFILFLDKRLPDRIKYYLVKNPNEPKTLGVKKNGEMFRINLQSNTFFNWPPEALETYANEILKDNKLDPKIVIEEMSKSYFDYRFWKNRKFIEPFENSTFNKTGLDLPLLFTRKDAPSPNYPIKNPVYCSNENCKKYLNLGLDKCGGCRKVYYCDVKCQKKDWPKHKKVCKKKKIRSTQKVSNITNSSATN